MSFRIIATILLASSLLALQAGAHSKKRSLYQEYKHKKDVMHLSFSTEMARIVLTGKENRDTRKLLRHVKKLRLLIYDGQDAADSLQHALACSFTQRNYTDLMTVNDGGDKVDFKMQQEKGYIREIAMIVTDHDSVVVVLFDGKIPLEDARDIAKNIRSRDLKM